MYVEQFLKQEVTIQIHFFPVSLLHSLMEEYSYTLAKENINVDGNIITT